MPARPIRWRATSRGSTPRSSSQPGRMLNDFRNLGFNQARERQEGLRRHDAVDRRRRRHQHELRFSQPGRTERNRQDQLYAEGVFPFANQRTTDPITGKTAGRYDTCTATNTCPLAMEIYSANEYWVKAASLLHTEPAGHERSARTIRWRATTSSRATSTATRQRQRQGRLPAVRQSARLGAGPARAVGRAGPLVDQGRRRRRRARAAASPTARWCRRCRKRRGLPEHSRRHLHRPEDRPATCFNYGPRLLRDRAS